MHSAPEAWRIRFVRGHLPPEGAWWLRDRVENKLPVSLGVLTVNDLKQAKARSTGKTNHGEKAAVAALQAALL